MSSSSDCTQPGCDRRALAGADLCGPHFRDRAEGREVIFSGASLVAPPIDAPDPHSSPRPKRERQIIREQELERLRRDLEAAAAQLVALSHTLRSYRLNFSLEDYLRDIGEREAPVNLMKAAHTLELYRGFIQLAAAPAPAAPKKKRRRTWYTQLEDLCSAGSLNRRDAEGATEQPAPG